MKPAPDKYDDEHMPDGPRSVFYRGRSHGKKQRLRSFKKPEEVQRALDAKRNRQERKPKR